MRLPSAGRLWSAIPAGQGTSDLSSGRGTDRAICGRSSNTHIEVVAGSSHAASLEASRLRVPNLSWVENPSTETEELLYRLSRREFDYTVADSNEFAIGRAFHPEIRIAFDLSGSKALAWAVDARDPSLLQRVTAFYASVKAEGRLASILDTYYGDVERFDYIQARVFMRRHRRRVCRNTATGSRRRRRRSASIGVCWRRSVIRNHIGCRRRRHRPACAG